VLGCALAAGCKSHESPAEQSQQLQAQENADVAQYQDQIRKIVKDPARADQLIAILSDVQKLVHETDAVVREDRAKIAALNANYNSTREDYEAVFAEQDTVHQAFFTKDLSLREQMAGLMTDDEWAQLKHARIKTLEAMMHELLQ
jgi:hypothetical protein